MADERKSNFIRQIVEDDLASGKHKVIRTRFPPEPNGYLHIGHAKSICLNFGLAHDYKGTCNLRFDDTNPEKEKTEYSEAIKDDVRWLGFNWTDLFNASDYFEKLYEFAEVLINDSKAFVCDLDADQMREYRGTLKEPGKESPYRNRSVAENLELFRQMRAGAFNEGKRVLRAKIDMKSPNINLRDPVIYRIKKAHHHMTGDKWCIYPMYDYAHGISDALEGITHSLCSLEFEDHRPLYDWLNNQVPVPTKPRQIEFARLKLNYTVMSKRKLKELVEDKHVDGWDDPRMPTVSGLRRRGYTAASIRKFCEAIGLSRADSIVDYSMLEFAIREDLDEGAPRAMCVTDPLKVVLTNVPEGEVKLLKSPVHQKYPDRGDREVPFTREIYIEREDFDETPPEGFHRLTPGSEVRLRNSYVIKCDDVIKNSKGEPTELRCSIDPSTLGQNPVGRKVTGIVHWVSATHSVPCEVRVYDRLFTVENPDRKDGPPFTTYINPKSLKIHGNARAELSLKGVSNFESFQFERLGFFCHDPKSAKQVGKPVFNRTVSLRDTWKK